MAQLSVPRVPLPSTVEEVMTRDVICLRETASLRSAAATLRRNRISGAPVTEADGRLKGVLSERDIVEAALAGLMMEDPRKWLDMLLGSSPVDLEGAFRVLRGRLATLKVEEVMTSEVLTVAPETLQAHAAERMDSRGIHRLPVLREGRLIGMVTRSALR